MFYRVAMVMCIIVLVLTGCGQRQEQAQKREQVQEQKQEREQKQKQEQEQEQEQGAGRTPDYSPFLTAGEGELRLVVLVQDKVREETRTVNDMMAAMAGRFTPVVYDVRTVEGKQAAQQLESNSREYPAYYLFNNEQLLAQGKDLSQIAQAAMDYTDRLSIGGTR
ncbi:hypothetical protein [Paenibacillus glycanilyticus]|uniref:Lipoprotein n=1 Tax=Paenibacillus glycanilyticus TaxID=126569 RepID=A0ABQ6GCI5_9BACL|nr:hypothetical protein [Paenibacillus glycanilyticus]GLX67296.1 hypothetical protein MU1_16410 [Paenibacillus glycanilyticus]